jgi:hypothetical protein
MSHCFAMSIAIVSITVGGCAGQPATDVVPPEEAKGQKIIFRGTAPRVEVAPAPPIAGERP